MKFGMTLGGLLLGGTALVGGYWLSQPAATAVPGDDGSGGAAAGGPDVIVGAIPNVSKWGASGGIAAYSFGTTSCNIGSVQLDWFANTNQHPVIPQNAFRLKDGRFEQIGMSWCKHGFCALQQNLCMTCQPAGGGCVNMLGIGCSDPYDSSLNGDSSNLGPRSFVNASNGVFPYPFTQPPSGGTPTVLLRRCQINNNDLDPAMNAGAKYYAECMYVHPDDAVAGNGGNNASYRQFTVGTFTSGAWNLSLTGATLQQQPVINAWKANDPLVTIVNVDVPGDGRFLVGYRVTPNGNGTWHYEYAVENLNSDRNGGSLTLPFGTGAAVSTIGFHDISYHSGETYSGTDWTVTQNPSDVTWSTQTPAQNPLANALRWATLYNFRFDANTPPRGGTGTLGMWKTGSPAAVTFSALVPSPIGDLNGDGVVDGNDLGILVGAWGTPGGDLNGDGMTDANDLGMLLGAFD